MRFTLVIALLFLVSIQTLAQGKRYDEQLMSKIKLLSTTREEAEKIIGKKIERYGDMASVVLPYGAVIFFFSLGLCDEKPNSSWNFPNGVITRVDFSPKEKPRISQFNFQGMRVAQDPSNPPIYIDDSTGIGYYTQLGRVQIISYAPSAKFDYLRCKQSN